MIITHYIYNIVNDIIYIWGLHELKIVCLWIYVILLKRYSYYLLKLLKIFRHRKTRRKMKNRLLFIKQIIIKHFLYELLILEWKNQLIIF